MIDKTDFINSIVEKLKTIPNILAITLGGSYAAGTQRPDSDIDFGLYYSAKKPFDINEIKKITSEINDTPNPIVSNFGEWGRWVNGGAWLTIKNQRVDFLYRDIDFVSQIITDCQQGEKQSDFYQQPPYGFHSYIYLAEINFCKPLFDPQNIIANLKSQIKIYPQALKKTIVDGFLWDAQFTLKSAEKSASRGETYIVAGCLTKIMSDFIQVIYALNETYFIGDKKFYKDILNFKILPANFLNRINNILGNIRSNQNELLIKLQETKTILQEIIILTNNLYTPKY